MPAGSGGGQGDGNTGILAQARVPDADCPASTPYQPRAEVAARMALLEGEALLTRCEDEDNWAAREALEMVEALRTGVGRPLRQHAVPR